MQKKQKFLEEADSEEYLHKAAWQVVMRQIEHAETDQTGALYDDLVAMVFAFHCMEGYLNFVGAKIAPELWKHEKERFGRTGIAGKLNAICERCGVAVPDKGRRPYSTVPCGVNNRPSVPGSARMRLKSRSNCRDWSIASCCAAPLPAARKSVHSVLPRKRIPSSTDIFCLRRRHLFLW